LLIWKLGSVALLAFAIVMAAPVQCWVSARMFINGEVHRGVSAPFDGFVIETSAHSGDTVCKEDS
jgi:hypothetical protein